MTEGIGTSPRAEPLGGTVLVAFCAGLLLPGAGHLVLRRYGKAAVLSTVLLGLFAFGLWMGWGQNFRADVVIERHPFSFYLQYLLGGPALAASHLAPDTVPPEAFDSPKRFELAILYTSVAALLNVLVLIDVLLGRADSSDTVATTESEGAA